MLRRHAFFSPLYSVRSQLSKSTIYSTVAFFVRPKNSKNTSLSKLLILSILQPYINFLCLAHVLWFFFLVDCCLSFKGRLLHNLVNKCAYWALIKSPYISSKNLFTPLFLSSKKPQMHRIYAIFFFSIHISSLAIQITSYFHRRLLISLK